ncbi:MAG: antibiotic ABC transporter ATP-binding protein [Gemmatimonadetes bacterium]|jgi:ATP-binding cassette subfamily B multidrug efflux pump|nr:antibiotic ABC transporter ATP-binding protein [Gemmatimonadota bacterium]HCK08543.1 antibiotic ABC transporter ATP-binding protein [Candidatus Latescibacterota bacterium]
MPDFADIHEEEVEEKPFDARLMVRLLAYLKPYAKWVGAAFCLILVTSVTRQAGPFLTQIAVDDHILVGDYAGLHGLVLIFMGLLILQFSASYVQHYITQVTGQWAMFDVRHHIFRHLQRLPLSYFDRTPIGRLMTRNTNDVDALNELFTDGIVVVFSDIFTLIAIIVFMSSMNAELAAVVCLVLPFMFLATFWFQGRMLGAFRRARSRLARLNAYLQENISGMEVVQLFNRERRNRERFAEINGRYLDARLESTLYFSLYFPIMEMFSASAIALVIWYGGNQVVGSSIQWGVLVAMLQYVPRFFRPILEISERYAILQAAMASSERIFELLDTEQEPIGGSHTQDQATGEIEFDSVWFAYQGEDWVLKDVSFRIAPGERVAIVGATGSGKTTIISLLNGFYRIQKGSIRVDGVDIEDWDVENLRKKVGIVQQDVFLFSGNIERNIRLGNKEITDKELVQAATDVNADGFVGTLGDGYGHEVTERGSTFSAGQRQLIAFARALAHSPDILILDEATSSVDTETEQLIQGAVERLMMDRTSIVIAHRISTIRKSDRIIVLHKGVIRECGSHEDLIQKEGIYHRLHHLQYLVEGGT